MLLLLGRPAEAAAAFEAALVTRAGHREAELGLAEARLAAGRPLDALQLLTPALGSTRDAWWLAARAAGTLGSAADAELFLARARADATPFLAWHREEAWSARLWHRYGSGKDRRGPRECPQSGSQPPRGFPE